MPRSTGLASRDPARAERRLAALLCAPAVLILLVVAGGPLVHGVWLSLRDYDLARPGDHRFAGLGNYLAVLTDGGWWAAVGVTVLVAVVAVVLQLVLGLVLALVMHRALVGRGMVRAVSLVPFGIVTVVAGYAWYFAWTAGSGSFAGGPTALDTWGWAVVAIIGAEVWKATPFVAVLLLAGLAQVPGEALTAAEIDGATPWQRWRLVLLPALWPAIGFAVLYRVLDGWRVFDHVFVLTGGSGSTASVSVLAHQRLFLDEDVGAAATMSTLMLLVAVLAGGWLIKASGVAESAGGRP